MERNFGRFQAVLVLIIFHIGEIWGQIGPLSTRSLSFPKLVAVCPKIVTSYLHTYFHSRCHWARVARLMTLQRSLQYSLRLSWTKTLFPKISNFCTSLDLIISIDVVLLFVAKFAKVPKDQSNILHPKMSQIGTNFLCNFCHNFSTTFGFFECNFLGGDYTGRLGWVRLSVISLNCCLKVLEIVRSNYDSLTLKMQDSLDQFERYSEKPKETTFFSQLVSQSHQSVSLNTCAVNK